MKRSIRNLILLISPIFFWFVITFIVSQQNQNYLLKSTANASFLKFGYRVSYLYNALDENKKMQFLSKIDNDLNFSYWKKIKLDNQIDTFEISHAIMIENRLLLFVYLPEYNFPNPSLDQGKFHAGVHVCPNCLFPNKNPGFNVIDSPLIFLSDKSWNNKHRVIVLPVDQTVFRSYAELLVYPLVKTELNSSQPWGANFYLGNLVRLKLER